MTDPEKTLLAEEALKALPEGTRHKIELLLRDASGRGDPEMRALVAAIALAGMSAATGPGEQARNMAIEQAVSRAVRRATQGAIQNIMIAAGAATICGALLGFFLGVLFSG